MNKISQFFVRQALIITTMVIYGGHTSIRAQTEQHRVHLMSWNITQDTKKHEKYHPWAQRRFAIIELVRQKKPDIIALQGMSLEQVNDLVQSFSDTYNYVSASRGTSWWGLGSDEHLLILWNKNKFELQTQSFSHINNYSALPFFFHKEGIIPRICMWVGLRSLESNISMYIFNTHLDNMFQASCVQGLTHTLQLAINKTAPQALSFVMGTFNTPITEDCLKLLTMFNFSNVQYEAKKRTGPLTTAHYWNEKSEAEVDYVFARHHDPIAIISYEVVKEHAIEDAPSHHRPVMAEIEIGALSKTSEPIFKAS